MHRETISSDELNVKQITFALFKIYFFYIVSPIVTPVIKAHEKKVKWAYHKQPVGNQSRNNLLKQYTEQPQRITEIRHLALLL